MIGKFSCNIQQLGGSMREIKYRMWNKKEKKMYQVGVLDFDDEKAYMKNYLSYIVSNYMFEDIELMQFTGLHDKNGKEIYEGDITDDGYNNIGVVKYGNYNCSCCEGVYGWYVDGGDIRSAECFLKVIGNIYENPELLKGADNIE